MIVLVGCDPFGLANDNKSLEDQVHSAMSQAPYQVHVDEGRSTKNYVVFRVHDVVSNTTTLVAFGGARNHRKCSRLPKLPHESARKRQSTGAPSFICVKDNASRHGGRPRDNAQRSAVAAQVETALCEEVVGGFGFECFD
jgi:hypothetical protein